MPWRIAVRMSIEGEKDSKVRNAAVAILKKAGFKQPRLNGKVKTGTWVLDPADPVKSAKAIADVAQLLADPAKHVTSAAAGVQLDHLWVEIENTDAMTVKGTKS